MQANIVIMHRSGLQVAPESFIFGVDFNGFDTTGPSDASLHDPRFHDLYYYWDFGEAYQFQAPRNLVKDHRNSGVAYGPNVSHTYRAAGEYVVSVRVVEPSSGKTVRTSLPVSVGNPDTAFPRMNTIFVDPDQDWTNAPAGAAVVTNLAAAFSAFQGNDRLPRRVILNRGKNYDFSGVSMGQNLGQEWPSCHIVAGPGTAAPPRVISTGTFFWWDDQTTGNGRDKDLVLQNIDFVGPFDSTTNSGPHVDAIATFNNPPHLLLVDGCSFDGFGHAIYNDAGISTNVDHRVTVVNDTTITNFGQWGMADSDKTALVVTGSALRAHPDALVDATPNQGAPLRTGGADRLNIIHSSEFYSRQGWSFVGPYIAVQPCLRLNSEGHKNARSTVQACSFEGGYTVLSFQRADGSTANAGNVLLEKNVLVGNHQTYDVVASHMGSITLRNNLFIFPDATRLPGTNNPINFFVAINADDDPVNSLAEMRVYNNTFVNRLTTGNHLSPEPGPEIRISGYSHVIVSNNIIHQPDIHVPFSPDAPLDVTSVLWTPYDKGYQASDVPLQAKTATPANTVATFAPLLGSAALGDADETQPIALDDFYGNQRPQYPSRGAFEMAEK